MISVEYRLTNFNSYIQILDLQQNSSALTHFRLSEPLPPVRVAQVEKHCFRPC
jgi:hypothetical protein